MYTPDTSRALAALLNEIVEGVEPGGGGFVLNSGDVGLLRSLEKIAADEASRSTNGGATIAAHAQHVRYGLSLMNRWAREGGNPFADATWNAAWKTKGVDAVAWGEIREGLRDEATAWLGVLGSPAPDLDADTTPALTAGEAVRVVQADEPKSPRRSRAAGGSPAGGDP